MKLLLISANRERSPYPVFPIGLAYLIPPLEAAGHLLSALDLCFESDPEAAVKRELASVKPDVVIISLRNLDNVTWPDSRQYLPQLAEICKACGEDAVVIVGGSGFSLMPVEIMAAVGADYGIVGEGEQSLPILLDAIASGASTDRLPGVIVPGADNFLPPAPIMQIGTPDRKLFDVSRYLKEGGMANLQTKRGCPFSCSYCTYPLLEGYKVRSRSIPEILAEINSLVNDFGVDYLYFVDDIFNFPTAFAEELCNAMVSAKLPVKWSAFINPDFITPKLLDSMVAAGCDAVEFGTDSGSPQMLENLSKSFNVEHLRTASTLCRQAGVDFAHYILFGGPGETEATLLESFELMDQLEPTAVIAMTGIRIYPGTALHKKALKEQVITPETDLLEPVFYISPLVRDDLCRIVTEEALKRKNWIVPGLEINVSDNMLEALRLFKVRGPLWKLMKKLGRSRVSPMAAASG
jgi:radical SAM superfamily enzyme YgiQ (UPF0313 family)